MEVKWINYHNNSDCYSEVKEYLSCLELDKPTKFKEAECTRLLREVAKCQNSEYFRLKKANSNQK